MLKLLPIKKDEHRTGKARSPANCGTFRLFFPPNREIQIAA